MTMDRLAIAAAMTLTMLSGCASEGPKPLPPAADFETTRDKDRVEETGTITVQAKVVSVNQKTRMVTLEDADGERVTFKADDAVKNLPQVKKGDMVTAVYQRAIAARLLKKGSAKPDAEAVEELYTAKPGEKPAAVGGDMVKIVATITKIDKKKSEITLTGPKGRSVPVHVRDPQVLERMKKGDLLEVTYTEAIAISVDTPAR